MDGNQQKKKKRKKEQYFYSEYILITELIKKVENGFRKELKKMYAVDICGESMKKNELTG